MAWIRTIDEPDPGSALRRLYEEQTRQAGAVANISRIHSLAPHILLAHIGLYKATMHTAGQLSQADREMIAVTVSRTNNCEY